MDIKYSPKSKAQTAEFRVEIVNSVGKGFKSGTAHGNHHKNEPVSYSEVLKNKSCNLVTV